MITFLRGNLRWLGAGLLLTFASAFGQTWFIALFAGEIKAAYGLTDGQWGGLYAAATLASAALLFRQGRMADDIAPGRLAPGILALFAAVAAGMALGNSVWLLAVLIFGLRFCGQGMMTHIAVTTMARWFRAHRGRAISIASLGYALAEMLLPPLVIALLAVLSWRMVWGGVALVLLLGFAPLLGWLLSQKRSPQGSSAGTEEVPGLEGRHWTRPEVLRHRLFWLLLPGMLTPGFIGTVVFFHQVHIAAVKGWEMTWLAPAYPLYAGVTLVAGLLGGAVIDRVGAARLLPVFLLPMGLGAITLGLDEGLWTWFVTLALLAVTQGTQNALWGAYLPVLYGTRHLGAVRAVASTAMVFSTAIGPGITGVLIDAGVDFPGQSVVLGLWCFAISAVFLRLALRGRAG
ncbi:MFS transporter [Paroceanicella profunda]|uniref:MFS transporter n=1 Tax=Paroceanicella profunda TaxID=2579971 RepID=A0A5B8FYK9_9RHOB|nr:MFS transporter [Paroceanicella profunda]QDL91749.1 MFS transporter [Paroceanicella profunda]